MDNNKKNFGEVEIEEVDIGKDSEDSEKEREESLKDLRKALHALETPSSVEIGEEEKARLMVKSKKMRLKSISNNAFSKSHNNLNSIILDIPLTKTGECEDSGRKSIKSFKIKLKDTISPSSPENKGSPRSPKHPLSAKLLLSSRELFSPKEKSSPREGSSPRDKYVTSFGEEISTSSKFGSSNTSVIEETSLPNFVTQSVSLDSSSFFHESGDRNVSFLETRSESSNQKCGWLYKQGENIRNWKKRWFVVSNSGLENRVFFLFYFTTKLIVKGWSTKKAQSQIQFEFLT